MFFRSLSVLATIACATFASAIPVGVSDLTKAAGGVALPNIKTPTIRRASGELKVVVAGKDITVPIGTRDVSKTDEHPSLPEVFSLAVQKLGPVNDKLSTYCMSLHNPYKTNSLFSTLHRASLRCQG